MKREASCKHRQAVKNIQCEKKLFTSHLHSSKLGKRVEKYATSTNQKMAASMDDGRTSCPLVIVKTKVKSAFLLWHHHGDTNAAFQLKIANF